MLNKQTLTPIFISGSVGITTLSLKVRDRLDFLVGNSCSFIVGDSSGAETAIQKYLSKVHCKNVLINCVGDTCKNNVSNWRVQHLEIDKNLNRKDFYKQLITKVAEKTDHGFVLWDGKSTDSREIIYAMLLQDFRVLVYFEHNNSFKIMEKKDSSSLLERLPRNYVKSYTTHNS